MTDDLEKRAQEIQDSATLGAGEGEPAASTEEIQGYLGDRVAEYANIVTEENLPADAEIRANGIFDDPLAMKEWLDYGGLIGYDDEGNPVPSGLVWAVETTDPVDGSIYYQIYIREGSGEI